MHRSRIAGIPLLIVALLAFPGLAAAHAHLESTDPAADANLDEPPGEVTLTFDNELQPDGSHFTVSDAQNHVVGSGDLDLDVAERNVLRGSVIISEPGVYTVTWEIAAADGHPDSGQFSFGYQAGHERDDAAPDTAAAWSQGGSPLAIVGAVLLIVAGLLGARRRFRIGGFTGRA